MSDATCPYSSPETVLNIQLALARIEERLDSVHEWVKGRDSADIPARLSSIETVLSNGIVKREFCAASCGSLEKRLDNVDKKVDSLSTRLWAVVVLVIGGFITALVRSL